MMALSVVLALLAQAPSVPSTQAPANTAKGVIAGIVTRAGGEGPIGGVQVTVQEVADPAEDPNNARNVNGESLPIAHHTETDADGRFHVGGLPTGWYLLWFERNGYVSRYYPVSPRPGWFMVTRLGPGETMDNIAIGMTPAGTISGRLRDPDRQPVAVAKVELLRYAYDRTGQRTLETVAWTQTDDRGEYRFYFVTPGRYYLSAGARAEPLSVIQRLSGAWSSERPNPQETLISGEREAYAAGYYPGVADPEMATIIDVPPGTDIGGLDMTLRKQALYRIRGRVIDSRTGMPPSSVRIRLTWRTAAGPGLFEPELNGTIGSYNPADGAFELRGILPGSYVLVATLGDSRASNFDPRSPDNKSPAAAAYAPVIVGAADAIGATLSLVSGASISARFTIEGPQPLAGSGIEKARVTLTNAIEGLPGREVNSYVPPNFPSAIGADGTFRFDNVLPGEYRLRVGNLPAGFYVKEARFGATDALTHPLEIGAAGSDTLTLVVSAGAAALSGTVTDEKEGKLNPQESVLVVLVPDRNRDRPELFHADISDSTGRFNFDEVAPGDYRVFAWTTLEPYAYFDPDVLRDALPYSTAVHVTERSSQHISVKIYAPR